MASEHRWRSPCLQNHHECHEWSTTIGSRATGPWCVGDLANVLNGLHQTLLLIARDNILLRPRALCVILMMMCFMKGFVSWLAVHGAWHAIICYLLVNGEIKAGAQISEYWRLGSLRRCGSYSVAYCRTANNEYIYSTNTIIWECYQSNISNQNLTAIIYEQIRYTYTFSFM